MTLSDGAYKEMRRWFTTAHRRFDAARDDETRRYWYRAGREIAAHLDRMGRMAPMVDW